MAISKVDIAKKPCISIFLFIYLLFFALNKTDSYKFFSKNELKKKD